MDDRILIMTYESLATGEREEGRIERKGEKERVTRYFFKCLINKSLIFYINDLLMFMIYYIFISF